MSVQYKCLFTSASGFNPTLPTSIKEMSVPFDWTTGGADNRHLFTLTRGQRDEWWKRFRRFNVTLSLTGLNTLDFGNFDIDRRMLGGAAITDEHDLRKPGMGFLHASSDATSEPNPCEYFAQRTITGFDSGPGNTADLELTVHYFRKIWSASNVVQYYPMHATGSDLWIPYLHIHATVLVNAGSEYQITLDSVQNGSGDFSGSFCVSHGGGNFGINLSSDGDIFEPTAVTLDFEPNLFFQHAALVNGVEVPKWDANTGERL